MDFPAFSSICSLNKAECGVYAVWNSVDFLLLLSVRMGNPVSLRRQRVKETKSQKDKKTKRQRVKESKRQRDEETKRRRDKGTKSQRDEGTKSQRVKETKGQRDEERKRQRDEKTKTASPPIHLLFTSYSCPLHRPIRSNLFNSCPKTFERFVFQNSTLRNTASWEVGKGDVGGKWKWETQESRGHSESRWQRKRLRRKP